MTKHLLFILLGLTTWTNLFSQSRMGIAHDNYNVTEALRLNPANAVDPKPWVDINIAGIYMFGASNAAYIPKDSFNLFQGQIGGEFLIDTTKNIVRGQVDATIAGPSITGAVGRYSLGLNTGIRLFATGRKLPTEFARGLAEGLNIPEYYGEPLNGSGSRSKLLGFAEVGVNVGRIVYQKDDRTIKVGAHVKYLMGLGGLNIIADDFQYSMYDTSRAEVFNFDGKYSGVDFSFHPGTGLGMDIGVVFEKKTTNVTMYVPHSPESNCKHIGYIYKFGFSVLDIGRINFTGSANRTVQGANGPWNNYQDTRRGNINGLIEDLDGLLANGITESSDEFSAWLPMSLVGQFDYNFGYGRFINITGMYGVPLSNAFGAERSSFIAVTPRLEKKHFGLSVPINVNSMNWTPGVGLGIRFWYLSFGTDNLIPYFINMDIKRFDAYAHLKVPVYRNRACKGRRNKEGDWQFMDCSAPGAKKYRARKSKRKY